MKKTASRGPGRPRYVPTVPNKRFTFEELCEANGVNTETGKGKNCTMLTLRKFLKSEMFTDSGNPKPNSAIMLVKDETREPNSKKGLGRKCFVYAIRKGKSVKKAKRTASVNIGTSTRKPKTAKVSTSTAKYEAAKLALTAPAPAPVSAPAAEVPAATEPAVTETAATTVA